MILKNMTSRVLNIVDRDGKVVRRIFPESKINIQMKIESVYLAAVDGVPVTEYRYTYYSGLPDPQPGVVYIVKSAVLRALKGIREDLVAPDCSPGSSRRNGRFVEGVRGFVRTV